MVVVAKVGITEKKGKVRTPAGIFEVTRGKDGWYAVDAPKGQATGKVRYDDDRNVLDIERPDSTLSIHFRGELGQTTFSLNSRTYEVAPMDFGNIAITDSKIHVLQSGRSSDFCSRHSL